MRGRLRNALFLVALFCFFSFSNSYLRFSHRLITGRRIVSTIFSNPRDMSSADDIPNLAGMELMKHRLLSFEDELELSKQFRLGMYIRNIEAEMRKELGTIPKISQIGQKLNISVDQIRLILINSETAKNTLVKANMRLIFHIARHYKRSGMAFADIVQEGIYGLFKAIEKYDGSKGFRFSTYASWWIKQSITRGVAEKARLVRLPVHVHDMLSSILRAERQHINRHGKRPSLTELATAVNMTTTKVSDLLACAKDVTSMDGVEYTSKDGNERLISEGMASDTPDPSQIFDVQNVRLQVYMALQGDLTEKELEVISLRYGLVDGMPLTLEDIGARYNVSRERIRQIESKALNKIRKPSTLHKVRQFLPEDSVLLMED